MVNDTISDFLARIKNGYLARKSTVSVPYAKALEKIGELMVESNYLENMEVISQKKDKKTKRRVGELDTRRGVIKTPFFMPIATKGAVKEFI